MNIKIVKLLAFIGIILAVILMAEWIVAKYAQHRLLAAITSAKSEKYQIDEVPVIDLDGKPEESYVDLVSRPLFIKGRRPVDEPSPEQAGALPGTETFDWQLNGVYTTQKGLSALFSRAKTPVAKDNYRKLKENDDLDGWKLIEIRKDKVILNQGSESRELLLRKPKLKELPKIPDPPQRRDRRSQPPPVPKPQSAEDAAETSNNE